MLTFTHLARLLKKPRLREAFMAFPAGVLACAHLARHSLPLRRQCSHSRTLKAHHSGALLSLAFPAGVLACAHLARREKRTDLSVLYGACSAVLTYTNLKKRTSTVRF